MVTISDTLSGNGSGPAVGVRPGIDLTTTYLGLSLRNPLVASPSPATSTVNRVKALAGAGVGAVVLPSLYEEQVVIEELREIGFTEPYEDAHGEAQGYFPVESGNQLPGATWRYLRLVEEAVEAVDVVLLWWRDGDGDLVDSLVDALTDLTSTGYVWLMTPKVGREGYVDAAELAEGAVTAGLSMTNSAAISSDWAANKLVRPKGPRR